MFALALSRNNSPFLLAVLHFATVRGRLKELHLLQQSCSISSSSSSSSSSPSHTAALWHVQVYTVLLATYKKALWQKQTSESELVEMLGQEGERVDLTESFRQVVQEHKGKQLLNPLTKRDLLLECVELHSALVYPFRGKLRSNSVIQPSALADYLMSWGEHPNFALAVLQTLRAMQDEGAELTEELFFRLRKLPAGSSAFPSGLPLAQLKAYLNDPAVTAWEMLFLAFLAMEQGKRAETELRLSKLQEMKAKGFGGSASPASKAMVLWTTYLDLKQQLHSKGSDSKGQPQVSKADQLAAALRILDVGLTNNTSLAIEFHKIRALGLDGQDLQACEWLASVMAQQAQLTETEEQLLLQVHDIVFPAKSPPLPKFDPPPTIKY